MRRSLQTSISAATNLPRALIYSGCVEGVFGISDTEIEGTLDLLARQSAEAQAENRVKYRWMALANMVQKCFERRGFGWTACRNNFELAQSGHKAAVAQQLAAAQAKKSAAKKSELAEKVRLIQQEIDAVMRKSGRQIGEDLILGRLRVWELELQKVELQKPDISEADYTAGIAKWTREIRNESAKLAAFRGEPTKILPPSPIVSKLQSAAGKRSGEVRRERAAAKRSAESR